MIHLIAHSFSGAFSAHPLAALFMAVLAFGCMTLPVMGNINQVFTGTPTSRRFALCPTTIVSGQAVLIGGIPAVALDSYQAVTGGTTFELGGSFALSVTAKSSLSPSVGAAINPGDNIYADGGTLDATTNITYGFTLDKNTGGTLFGQLDPEQATIASAVTNTAATVALLRGM